jgi:cellulose synthase/poly-beta-1,6-N-acetylglucosamine synthase-like glycosyltransferase
MLTRALILVAGWLLLSFLVTFFRGTKVKESSRRQSLVWLMTVTMAGNAWALLTFGVPEEIALVTLLTWIIGWWWIKRLPHWNALGQVTWIMTLLTVLLFLLYSFAVTIFTPLHPLVFVAALIFFFIELVALALTLTFAYETLDVCCRVRWQRGTTAVPPLEGYLPKVSLHVPTYNEPRDVVEKTLRSLARLDYPNFEVLLVDNNTPDEATWRPLEDVCRQLGPHFRCLHLDNWPGYKSGALNFALTQTAPDTEIIAIIDADYDVSPDFLRSTVSAFADPQVAFVQTPQDYREHDKNSFMQACYFGYRYFFDVSMPSRNERNAIIFCGTMGLIRKSVLQEIGGWDEWCITEDAEASLRILNRGYESLFINKVYGRGLMPYTFEGLKKQRFRWCFGGIQLLRKHWELLTPWARVVDPANRLTWAQRYYYLVGGMQWFNELLNLAFVVFLIAGAVLALLPTNYGVRPLTGPLVILPAVFLVVGLWRFLWALRNTLHLNWRQSVQAMSHFFSLGWTVALACIQGLTQREGVFMRTPKSQSRSGLVRALRSTQWETTIGLACGVTAAVLFFRTPQLMALLLAVLLTWYAAFYLAAPAYSLLSIWGQEVRPIPSRAEIRGRAVAETGTAIAVVAAFTLFLLGANLLRAMPEPAEPARVSRFQPAEVPPRRLVGLDPVPFEQRRQAATRTPAVTDTPATAPEATATPPAAVPGLPTPGASPSPGITPSPQPTGTAVPPATATQTATPTPAPAQTPTATSTVAPTAAPTPTVAPTLTPMPTSTLPPTPTPTAAPTLTPMPTSTLPPTPTPTAPATPTPTLTPTAPATPTPAPTATPASTAPSPTPTPTAPPATPSPEAPAPTATAPPPPTPTEPPPATPTPQAPLPSPTPQQPTVTPTADTNSTY